MTRWLAVVLLLAGCATFRPEPRLPFPDPPDVQMRLLHPGVVCLTEADARALATWLEQLQLFRDARERLLEGR